jgi:hypothetical protein
MASDGFSRSQEDLFGPLRKTFRDSAPYAAVTDAAVACLRQLADSGDLSALAERHAGSAIGHQNGFLKLTLFEPPDRSFRLRMHVWSASTGSPCPDIHNHTRDYWSLVLAGCLRVEEFAPIATGEEYHEFVASNRTPDRRYVFSYRGVTRIGRTHVQEVGVGQWHSALHAVCHRVRIRSYPACTLFLQGPERRSDTVVLSTELKEVRHSCVTRPSCADVSRALRSIGL